MTMVRAMFLPAWLTIVRQVEHVRTQYVSGRLERNLLELLVEEPLQYCKVLERSVAQGNRLPAFHLSKPLRQVRAGWPGVVVVCPLLLREDVWLCVFVV